MLWVAGISVASAQLSFVGRFGNIGSAESLFIMPTGVSLDKHGNVYVADSGNDRVQRFTATGGFIMAWGSSGDAGGSFDGPYGIAVDAPRNILYVTDRGNNRVQKFTTDGAFLNAWGSLGSGEVEFDGPSGITVDRGGRIYIADTNNHRIHKMDGAGNFILDWGSNGSGQGQFESPMGLAVDRDNNIYVADTGNDRIQKFTKSGQFLMSFGMTGSGSGRFDEPTGIAVDEGGNIYVVDQNDRIQKFDSEGNFIAKAGGSGSGTLQFDTPTAVAVNEAVDIYVADSANNRIQILTGFVIPPGMSGSFADPDFLGQGINIEILSPQVVDKAGKGIAPGTALVYWYSFDDRGFPFFSFGVGEFAGNIITARMLWDAQGPFFGPDWNPDLFFAGNFADVIITARGCDDVSFRFDPFDNFRFPAHPMEMERLTSLVGVPCVITKADTVATDEAIPQRKSLEDKGFAITRGLSGSFFDPDFLGQGINIEILSDQVPGTAAKGGSPGLVLLYWYSFGPLGRPFFSFGVGEYSGDTMVVDMLFDMDGLGPFFGPDWDASLFIPVPFATVTIVWSGCNAGTMSFVVDNEIDHLFEAHLMAMERATSVVGLGCP